MPTLDQAARQLGISEKTLRKWMQRLGIERTRHPQDWRYWLITDEQLQQIAEERAQMPGSTRNITTRNISIASELDDHRRQSEEGRYLEPSQGESATPRQRQKRTRAPKAESEELPPMPDGHIGRQQVGPDHGIKASTGIAWCRDEGLEILPGEYQSPTGAPGAFRVLNPLTPKGLRAFVAIARTRQPEKFHVCDLCPHAEGEG